MPLADNPASMFAVTHDGKHVAMFSYSEKSDVYMIRNFGKLLQR